MAPDSQRVATIEFDEGIFGVDCVKRAAYSLADLFATEISSSEEKVKCILHFADAQTSDQAEKLLNRFRIAVIDYDLRQKIREETEPLRSAILAYAYSKTNLQNSE
jgi:His-Xaa-Ser system protein HxsD